MARSLQDLFKGCMRQSLLGYPILYSVVSEIAAHVSLVISVNQHASIGTSTVCSRYSYINLGISVSGEIGEQFYT